MECDPSQPSAAGMACSGPAGESSRRFHLCVVAALVLGLAAYFALFYWTPLPSVTGHARRLQWLLCGLLLPEQSVHAWLGDAPRFMLLDRLPLLGVALLILGFALLLGRVLLRAIGADAGLDRLEKIVFSCGVGLNSLSLYVLAIGLLGWLTSAYVLVVPVALTLAAAAWPWVRQAWDTQRSKRRVASDERANSLPNPESRVPAPGPPATSGVQPWASPLCPDLLGPGWLWLAVPFVAFIVLGGMLPPTNFEARECHLQVPKEFYQQGRIEFLQHNVFGNMTLGSEMLTLLAMVVMGDWWYGALAGKTVIAATAAVTALGLFAAGRRFFSPAAGIVAALVYISIPWVSQVSTSGLVEGVSAFYLLLAVYAVMLWRRDAPAASGLGRVLLAGFVAGAAVACKYPAALFVVLPLAAWLWLVDGRTNWKPAGVFLLAVLAGCGLWFGKNWVLAKNPTYPLFFEVFGGATRTMEANEHWMHAHLPRDFSVEQLAASLSHVAWRSEWLSPLLMPLALLAWCVRHERRTVAVLWMLFGVSLGGWWLLTKRHDRFWIAALPLVALLAGLGASWTPTRAWRRLLKGVLAGGLAANLVFQVSGPGGYNAYFASLAELRSDDRRADICHLALNNLVPEGYRVLAVGDAQVFDLEMPVIYNTVFDESQFLLICEGRTAAQVRDELVARRISHVFVHWGEIARYRRPGNYGFPSSIQPKLFAELVSRGVLEPPMMLPLHPGHIYPVRSDQQLQTAGVEDSQKPILVPVRRHF